MTVVAFGCSRLRRHLDTINVGLVQHSFLYHVARTRHTDEVHESISEPAVDTLPAELDSPRAKLVYLYIATADSAHLTDLQATLGLKKITLFSILDTLQGRDLIEERGDAYAVAS
ncbi:hypothetical protein SAMN06269185_1568 [Natronoarchaeum philippinense]|uniref:Sugar-specific transcriptional regulator TrmB n=1 Tax=Natronoarchaeum philippinense TaxID=558529 RepID=A0A285NX53_NATPI|nr:hypothetical protein SAMN06269185_1568 [Natronoarchaeum philippinense]